MSEADKIYVEVITPDKEVLRAMVESLNVPAAIGMTGVLADHAPLLSVLVPGVVEYHKDGKDGCLAISEGFMEVRDNEVQLLVKTAELAEDIDEARAMAALERAQKRLEDQQANWDKNRAEAALTRAKVRLRALGKVMR